MNKKIFVILFSFFSVFLFIGAINHSTVSAVKYCSTGEVNKYLNVDEGLAKMSEFSEEIKTCACNPRETSNDCTKVKNTISAVSAYSRDKMPIKVYVYNLKKGSGGDTSTTYGERMQDLVALIKNIINTAIGIIIFILGFGFVYNMINLGAASNNPQRRQEVIGKIGDIFATAMFIGMIPLITSICLSIVGSLNR